MSRPISVHTDSTYEDPAINVIVPAPTFASTTAEVSPPSTFQQENLGIFTNLNDFLDLSMRSHQILDGQMADYQRTANPQTQLSLIPETYNQRMNNMIDAHMCKFFPIFFAEYIKYSYFNDKL